MATGIVSSRKLSTSNAGYRQTVTTVAGYGDPAYESVSLLLLANGVNGGTNSQYVDSSANNLTVTPAGTPMQGSFSPVTGSGGVALNGTTDLLTTQASSNLQIGTADFTVELWLNTSVTTISGSNSRTLFYNDSAANGFQLYMGTGSGVLAFGAGVFNGVINVATGTWRHIALTRSGTTMRIFVDGVQDGSATVSTNFAGTIWTVGGVSAGNGLINGNIANFRFVRGTALYTGNFTVPTIAPTAVTNTQLLLNFANANIVDSSTSRNTVSVFGNAQTSTTQRKYGVTSIALDGTGDYLTAPAASGISGTGDFTVESWVYPTSSANFGAIYEGRTAATQNALLIQRDQTTGLVRVYINGAFAYTATTPAANNQWTHVAVCRSGGTLRTYINGILDGSAANSTNFITGQVFVGIDYSAINSAWLGFMDDYRITRGLARYTANFTPPQSELASFKPPVAESSVVAAYGDTYWDNTTLLLLGNGVNGGTNSQFRDSSSNALAITPTGAPAQGSFAPVANGSSTLFNGSSEYLTTAASTGFVMAGDHTIEVWIYPTTTGSLLHIFGAGGSGSADQLSVVPGAGSGVLYYGTGGVFAASLTIPISTWTHIAMARAGSTIRGFVNGIQIGTQTTSATIGQNAAQRVGLRVDAVGAFAGYMSDLRVVAGTALYTQNFAPPTTRLTAVAGTQLLLNFANANIVDSSPAKNTITLVGNTQTSVTRRKYGVTSMYFDGTGDYLSIPNNELHNLAGGEWTIEFWAYPSVVTGAARVAVSKRLTTTASTSYSIFITTGGFWSYFSDGTTITGTIAASANTWQYVTLVRRGNTITLYVNGISAGTVTGDTSTTGSTGNLWIGNSHSGLSEFFTGYLDDFRITKGVARYLTNFQPPISELPAFSQPLTTDPFWNQTSLLLKGDGANNGNNNTILDSSPSNLTITSVGNPIQGSFSPFSPAANSGVSYSPSVHSGSVFFNGTSDYLTLPTGFASDFSTNNFTLECWVYPQAFATYKTIFAADAATAATANMGLLVDNVGGMRVSSYTGSTNILINSSINLSLNQWTHVAYVRNGSIFTLYFNGVSVGTASNTGAINSNNLTPTVGNSNDVTTRWWSGYISNLRVIKGSALYTGNFTVPTQPLAPISVEANPANRVAMLLNMNGPNGGTTFTDEKGNVFTVFNATTSTAQIKYGSASGLFVGASAGCVYTNWTSAFNSAGNDFTLELFFRPTSWPGWGTFWWNGTNCVIRADGSTLIVGTTNIGSFVPGTGTWHHLALSVQNNTARVYFNGTLIATINSWSSTITEQAGGQVFIGSTGSIWGFNGHIDDFRITRGVARYTSAFTPPTQQLTLTDPIGAVPSNLLLLGANANIYDSRMSNNLRTVGDSRSMVAVNKFGPASIYFDGAVDHLFAPQSANWALGSVFTIEGWFYTNGAQAVSFFDNRDSNIPGSWGTDAAGVMGCQGATTSNAITTAAGAFPFNQWVHVALSSNGTNMFMFVNGTQVGTAASIAAFGTGTRQLTIGAAFGPSVPYLNGYIDDYRITKGIARYTASFIPPTRAHFDTF
jgi:hypothetical protein